MYSDLLRRKVLAMSAIALSFGDDFEPERAVKKSAAANKIGSQLSWQREGVPPVLDALIEHRESRLVDVAAEIANRHPGVKAKANFLGLALTLGVGGKNGVGLLTERGCVLPVRDNCYWCHRFLVREGLFADFLSSHDLTEADFFANCAELPTMAERRARIDREFREACADFGLDADGVNGDDESTENS